jgi:hypothetical protein
MDHRLDNQMIERIRGYLEEVFILKVSTCTQDVIGEASEYNQMLDPFSLSFMTFLYLRLAKRPAARSLH